MQNRLFLTIVWILCLLPVRAQLPVFKAHPLSAGEPGWQLNTVFQDKTGFCWIGAKEGLLRYDGVVFHEIKMPDTLSQRSVTAIIEWKNTLYVGFSNGKIGQLQLGQSISLSKITLWEPEEGTPAQKITAFAIDGEGDLWFSTYGEGVYACKFGHIYQFNSTDDDLTGNEIYALTSDATGRIWAATDDGISICSMPQMGQKKVDHLTSEHGLPDEIVTALHADQTGVWIGTYDRGICHYNLAKGLFDKITPDWSLGTVNNLLDMTANEIWVATTENGLVQVSDFTAPTTTAGQFSPAAFLLIQVEKAVLPGKNLFLPPESGNGIVWCIADQLRLYSINGHFGFDTGSPDQVQAVIRHSNGTRWIGTADGLYLHQNGQYRSVLPGANIISLYQTPLGLVWAGSFGQGAVLLSPEGKVLKRYTESTGLSNGSILSITGNSQYTWLATLGGVNQIDQAGKVTQPNIGSSFIYAALADDNGCVWFGTDGYGLICLNNGQVIRHDSAAGLSIKTIYSLTKDSRNKLLWFSTDRNGVFSYNGQQFRHFGKDQGLHHTSISGIQSLENGGVLVAYEDGFDILNPVNGNVQFYGTDSGWPAATINLNALTTDQEGNILLGAKEGLLKVKSFGQLSGRAPSIILDEVEVFLNPIDFGRQHIFSYNENYISFQFTGLWLEQPDALRYRYKLEGFDIEWNETRDRKASYPNLPYGQYTFIVEASANGQFGYSNAASYTFVIKPPFWRTWWFLSLMIALISGIIYGLIRLREDRLQRDEALRRERIEAELAILKSQINPHFLFNSFNTLSAIIEENPKIAVDYVDHLSDFYRSIMMYRERDTIPVSVELDLVRNFAFLLRKRYESGFDLVIPNVDIQGDIIPFSLQILVENAVKHNVISTSKPLKIEILNDTAGYITVRNNIQPKLKPEPGTHFGLASLKKRYEIGRKLLFVEQTEQHFIVKVPILPIETGNGSVSFL